MTLHQLFGFVNRSKEIKEGRFCDLYNLSVDELCSQYGKKYVLKEIPESGIGEVNTINDEKNTFDEYDVCIANNILYLDTGNTTLKEMSLSEGDNAYSTVWKAHKPRRVLPRNWHDLS